jgi:hypothetical protein
MLSQRPVSWTHYFTPKRAGMKWMVDGKQVFFYMKADLPFATQRFLTEITEIGFERTPGTESGFLLNKSLQFGLQIRNSRGFGAFQAFTKSSLCLRIGRVKKKVLVCSRRIGHLILVSVFI